MHAKLGICRVVGFLQRVSVEGNTMELRVISWNIHKGIGGADRRYRLDRVIDLIKHVKPDIALLQEVAEGWPQARFEVQIDELRDALDMPHVAFGPEHRFTKGGYGNATAAVGSAAAVPEPATVSTLLIALACLGGSRFRRAAAGV